MDILNHLDFESSVDSNANTMEDHMLVANGNQCKIILLVKSQTK